MKEKHYFIVFIILSFLSIAFLTSCDQLIIDNKKTYTIKYENTFGVNNDNPSTYKQGDDALFLVGLEGRLGYEFIGWYLDDQGQIRIDKIFEEDINIDKESKKIILYAHWQLLEYSITYEDTFDLTNSNVASYNIETNNIILQNLDNISGLTFIGWYTQRTEGERITEITKGSMGNISLYARWEAQEFAITYENTFDVANPNPVTYNVNVDAITLENLADRPGYRFVGWYTHISEGTKVNEILKGTIGNLVLFARWTPITFEVKFLVEDGILISGEVIQEIAYGESAIAPVFEKEGYSLYWDRDFSSIKENLEVNAYWVANKYNVVFNGNGGILIDGLEQQTINHGEQIEDIPEYLNLGYGLVGWYSEDELFDFAKPITKDIHLIAQWEFVYQRINKDNVPDENGDYLLFGYYPQSIKAPNVPIFNMPKEGYFSGNDGAIYKKVYANPYATNYTFSNGTAISNGGVYYFKIEPIRWRILSGEDDVLFIICDSIIDTHIFNEFFVGPNEYGAYPNNYAHSFIRNWLNNDFFNDAFSSLQKAFILTTEVDNSELSTGNYSSEYTCENTNDKIFLLSFFEATNYNYGFSNSNANCDYRKKITSDYSRAMGAYMNVIPQHYGFGLWHFRSPSLVGNNYVKNSYSDGVIGEYRPTEDEGAGVVPALKLKLG